MAQTELAAFQNMDTKMTNTQKPYAVTTELSHPEDV